VVLKPGIAGTPQLAAELQEHVKKTTAPYKYPRELEFAAELPKNASGKLLRRVLRVR
jgi:acetyl-CoA synthetase